VAVAEELNFTRAAARVFVAQQAVSREIRHLEERLGTPLFVRTTRRVALTPEGQRLLVRARQLITLHDEIVDDVLEPSRPIVVDLLSDGRLTGPRILEASRTAAPELDFRGRYGHSTGAAMRLLEAGELDIAIGRVDWVGQARTSALERRLVRWEPLAVMLPRGHPLASLDAVPVGRLSGLVIDANPGDADASEWTDLVTQFVALSGAIPSPPHLPAIGLDDQAHHLIREGLPILTGVDHVEVPGGVVRPLVDPTPIYPWSIVWRRGIPRAALTAILAATDLLTDEGEWLSLPEGAWLPEPEASRVTVAPG
jgi:DNA-binding transcriptional LysR family regulator